MEYFLRMSEWDPVDERRRFHRIGFAFFAFSAVSFASAFLLQLLWFFIVSRVKDIPWREVPVPGWLGWAVTMVALYVIAAPIAYSVLSGLPHKAPPCRRISARAFFFLVCIAFAMMLIGSTVGTGINVVITLITGREQSSDITNALLSSDLWLSVLYTGILAPVMEELFFRKLLIDRLSGLGDTTVMLLSGLLFGLFHGNIEQFCYAFLLGALLAYIYLKSGKIRYCIGVHAIINFFGGLLPTGVQMLLNYLLRNVADEKLRQLVTDAAGILTSFPIYLLATIGCIVLIWYFKQLRETLREGHAPLRQVAPIAFGSLGMILFFCISLVQILLTIFS